MSRRWEYLKLILERSTETRKRDKSLAPWEEAAMDPMDWPQESYRFYSDSFYIWRPGAEEAEVREGWSTEHSDRKAYDLALLNELGEEGWELVDRALQSNTMGSSPLGWTTAAWPIVVVWTFKRPLS